MKTGQKRAALILAAGRASRLYPLPFSKDFEKTQREEFKK